VSDPEAVDLELPHDIEAERKVLSAMLCSAAAIDAVTELLDPEDFYRPGHQDVYRTMAVMRACGDVVAVETVRDRMAAEGLAAGIGVSRAGEYLFDLSHLNVFWEHAASFAGIVLDRAVRRRWVQAGTRIVQYARTPGDTGEMTGRAAAESARAEARSGDSPRAPRLMTPAQLGGTVSAKPEPVIPGFLNQMDRVVTVGNPGSGKTTLAYQVAAGAAVGRHPFAAETFAPVRVMAIDLEMPAYLLNETLEMAFRGAMPYGNPEEDGRFQVFHHPRGLNVLKKANAQLLTGLIRRHRPDLIVGGPAYKMHGDTGERGDHTGVMDFWDEIRDRFRCALWLETHPAKVNRFGKRDWTPAGSGRWADWPEIGFALVPDKTQQGTFEVQHFRGMRDRTRPWPEKFLMNAGTSGWAWGAQWPPGTL
jgi:hypothetical protein